MRIIVLTFGFFLALQAALQAQGGVRAGFQVSPTWSWMRTNDKSIEGVGTNWGLKFGAELEFPNLKRTDGGLAFVTGLGLGLNQGGTLLNGHQQGVFWPETNLSTPVLDTLPRDARLTYHVTHLEIPIGGRIRFEPVARAGDMDIRINIDGGGLLGIRTRAVGDIRGAAPAQTEDEDIANETSSIALSWQLGLSAELERSGGGSFVIGLVFQQQFTDLTKDNGSVFDTKINAWRQENSRGAFNMLSLRLAYYL